MERVGIITCLCVMTFITAKSSTSSLTGASSGNNLGGCPQLRNDCNFDCLSIDDKGCITCTCSGSSQASGLAGGSTLVSSGSAPPSGNAYAAGSTLTSATSANSSGSGTGGGNMGGQQSDLNMNNCPKLPNNCNYDCLEIGSNGCITCTCTGSGSSNGLSGGADLTSSGSNSGSGSSNGLSGGADLTSSGSNSGGQMTSTNYTLTNSASSNGNNCPVFPNNCRAECAHVDSNFCPVCDCTSTSTGNYGNLGDCPPFPTNCRSDCLSVRSDGCPLCNCTSTLGNKNGNECPPFPTNCRAECLSISREGCPLCSCTSGANTNVGGQTIVNNAYNNVKPGAGNNVNNCPQFDSSCLAQCTSTDRNGCPVCLCAASTPVPSQGQLSLQSNTSSECPATIPNCNSACLWTDDYGCILCNGDCNDAYVKQNNGGSNIGTAAPATAQPGNPCPNFDSNCPAKCSSFDVRGCLICTCSAATTPSPLVSSTVITCPVFDSTTCNPACLGLDSKGCLSCHCGGGSNTGSSGTLTTAAPLVPTGSGTGTVSNGPIIGTNCPVFDLNCPAGCASVDDNGCLKCTCSATNPGSVVKTTDAPTINNCPTFDLSCPANCAKVDSQGCLSCTCTGTPQGQEQGTTASPSSGNINNCPVFDTSCPAGCAMIDAQGCLSCTCKVNSSRAPVTIKSTVPPRPSTTASQNTVCPAFDGSNCDVSCLGLDASGCLSCTCNKPITSLLNVKTTAAPPFIPGGGPVTTFAPGATGGNFVPGGGFISTHAPAGTTGNFVPGGAFITTAAPSGTAGTFIPGGGFISTYAPQQSTANFVPGGGVISTFASIMPGGTTTGPVQTSTPASVQKVTAKCPKFDDSCPAGCAALDTQGCLKCTCSVQSNQTVSSTTLTPLTQTTVVSSTHQTLTPGVCPPVRCLPPCNKLELGSDNCPRCKCDATTSAQN